MFKFICVALLISAIIEISVQADSGKSSGPSDGGEGHRDEPLKSGTDSVSNDEAQTKPLGPGYLGPSRSGESDGGRLPGPSPKGKGNNAGKMSGPSPKGIDHEVKRSLPSGKGHKGHPGST
ncbi:unnamed protein product [Leptidea sinapis]|uniref:Uncharacterized protein n=1 Tax=Leptidea sinapis TaxID=189913 RepID=A0A5E4R6F5_9NEOP|nr:unnamed protein product [Leptidea sinapis]